MTDRWQLTPTEGSCCANLCSVHSRVFRLKLDLTNDWQLLTVHVYLRINGDLYGGHVLIPLFVVGRVDCGAEKNMLKWEVGDCRDSIVLIETMEKILGTGIFINSLNVRLAYKIQNHILSTQQVSHSENILKSKLASIKSPVCDTVCIIKPLLWL